MAAVKKLDIDLLRLDKLVQMRALGDEAHVDSSVVEEYREAMEAGAKFPPIVAYYDGADYWVADGFHRLEAARGLKKAKVDVEVREGTIRDAQLFAMQANLKHGARATRADKEKAVLVLLKDEVWGTWSQTEIAARAGVSISTVANIRARHGIEAPTERTYTREGKVQTMQTKSIGKKPTAAKEKASVAKEKQPVGSASTIQIGELPELDAKEQRKAQDFADRYGVSLAEAERYQQVAKKKRQQDAIERAERLAQARIEKQKKQRALKRKAKTLTKKELEALALAQQVADKLGVDVEDVIAIL